MDPDRERRALELFELALEAVPRDLAAFLVERCRGDHELLRRVEELFARDATGDDFLARPRVEVEMDAEEGLRREIGPYRIVQMLARGGTSSVFLGEDAVGRRAAVKVLHVGLDTPELRRRFAAEYDVLTDLRHPAIAAVLGSGTTVDGLPWLATELIDGAPLTEHCDRRTLPVRARLELFVALCAAVQHAHAHLVVHRDLKPSNVLVDGAGQPKLLDFGIAKLLAEGSGPRTETAARVLTVNYASPEHLAGERVTTASDVYSLGIVLCELLSGRRPWDWSTMPREAAVRALGQLAPPRVSRLVDGGAGGAAAAASRGTSLAALRRQLRGDLDAIVERALAHDPAQRYASASELAADLRRHLDGEPVLARPRSAAYRTGKLVRRHAMASAAGALVVLAVLAFAVVSRYQLVQVRTERAAAVAAERRAEEARSEATEVTRILTDSFAVASTPAAVGGPVAARRILDEGTLRAEQLAAHPALQASLLHALGVAHDKLGLYRESSTLFDRALALRRRLLGSEHPVTLETLVASCSPLRSAGGLDLAERRSRAALAALERRFGASHAATASAAAELGAVLAGKGRLAEAQVLVQRALTAHRADPGSQDWVAADLRLLGTLSRRLSQFETADRALSEALELLRNRHGDEHREVTSTLTELAQVKSELGNVDEGIRIQRQALELTERLLGAAHPEVALQYNELGVLLHRRADYDGARAAFQAALDLNRRVFGDNHAEVALAMSNLAAALPTSEEAIPLVREALAIRRRTLPPGHPDIAQSLNNLAVMLFNTGHWPESERLYRESLASYRSTLGPHHVEIAKGLFNLGMARWEQGDVDEAERLFHDSLAEGNAAAGPGHTTNGFALNALAMLHRRRGDLGTAERRAREAFEVRHGAYGDRHQLVAGSRCQVAAVLAVAGVQLDEAKKEAERSIAAYDGSSADDWRLALAHVVHGLAVASAGDPAGVAEARRAYRNVRQAWPTGSIWRTDAGELLALAERRLAAAGTRPRAAG